MGKAVRTFDGRAVGSGVVFIVGSVVGGRDGRPERSRDGDHEGGITDGANVGDTTDGTKGAYGFKVGAFVDKIVGCAVVVPTKVIESVFELDVNMLDR